MGVANHSVFVDQIFGRAEAVGLATPSDEIVIQDHRPGYPVVLSGVHRIVQVFLEFELGRMHSDDDQSVVLVLGVPLLQKGHGTDSVDAGMAPKIDQDNLSAQSG